MPSGAQNKPRQTRRWPGVGCIARRAAPLSPESRSWHSACQSLPAFAFESPPAETLVVQSCASLRAWADIGRPAPSGNGQRQLLDSLAIG